MQKGISIRSFYLIPIFNFSTSAPPQGPFECQDLLDRFPISENIFLKQLISGMLFLVSISGIFRLQEWFCSWKCFAHAKLRTNIQIFLAIREIYSFLFCMYLFLGVFLFLKIFIYLFAYAGSLLLVRARRGYSSLWYMGFSLLWILLLRSTSSERARFSTCGRWTQQL